MEGAATKEPDNSYAGMRADKEGFQLQDPGSLLTSVAEFNDNIQLQIPSIFPGFILQQIHNAIAVRQIVPRGVDSMDLNWTYLGFADDTPAMRTPEPYWRNPAIGSAPMLSRGDWGR